MSGREAGRRTTGSGGSGLAGGRAGNAMKSSRVGSIAGDEEELRAALENAFDYRGDVQITRKDGSQS